MNLRKYFDELKKRHVIKAGLAYLVGAWAFTEVSSLILDSFEASHLMKTILIILAIGFPVWLVFSWVYDITSEGIRKTGKKEQPPAESRRIDKRVNRTIIALLSIAVLLLTLNQIRTSTREKGTTPDAGNNAPAESSLENSMEFIAVLPFFNSRSDPESDYLGFALADQIIGGLVYLKNITVRPSASVRHYEQQTIDPKQVGDELNVDYVLMGNYLKEASSIRLNMELINISSNKIIWHKSLEHAFKSAFELQDLVAQQVMDGMNVQFTQKEINRIKKDIPSNPLAYEYFLRSISYELSNEGDRMAIQMINQSIELDSTFAPAYLQLGDRLHRYAQYGLLNPEETARAERAFLKALELNDELINAYGYLAMLYTETNRGTEAVELIKRMLELNPNSAEAHFALGYLYRYAGMNEAAVEQMETAVSIDPNNVNFRSICNTYLYAGMYDKALHAAGLYAKSGYLLHIMGQARFRQGKYEQALEYFNQSIELDPGKLAALTSAGIKAYIEDNRQEGIQAAMKFEEYNLVDAEAWYFFAGNYGLLNDKEGCLRCLRRAVDGGFFNYPLMNRDFYLDSVREEEEFRTILEDARIKHLAFRERFF